MCLNDKVAFGTYQAIADAGLRVPEDISVVSFDDSDIAAWLRPGLTSIAIPHFEMGQLAVELLAVRDARHRTSIGCRCRSVPAAPWESRRRSPVLSHALPWAQHPRYLTQASPRPEGSR